MLQRYKIGFLFKVLFFIVCNQLSFSPYKKIPSFLKVLFIIEQYLVSQVEMEETLQFMTLQLQDSHIKILPVLQFIREVPSLSRSLTSHKYEFLMALFLDSKSRE